MSLWSWCLGPITWCRRTICSRKSGRTRSSKRRACPIPCRAPQGSSGGADVRYIDTVQKLGYRFTYPLRTVTASGSRGDIEVLRQLPRPAPRPHQTAALPAVETVDDLAWSIVATARNDRRWRARTARRCCRSSQYAREVPPPPAQRFDDTVPGHIILTDWDHPVISPDGRRVAFTGISAGLRQLWVRPLQSTAPILLPGTEGHDSILVAGQQVTSVLRGSKTENDRC